MTHPHLEGLIPCPFCGRAPKYSSRADWHTDTKEAHFIACYCGGYSACAHQFGATREAVVAAWNRRPTLAALPGGGVDEWQPIDTAPKDGTVVLVTVAAKDAEVEKGYFNRGAWYVVNNGDYFDGGHGNDYRTTSVPGNGNYGLPTHWRPLPPTPNPHEADRNGND